MSAKNVAQHLAFGAGHWNTEPENLGKQREMIDACRRLGIKTLDTARHYANGQSETFIGDEGLSTSGEFKIMTKAPMCLSPGGATKEGVLKGWEESKKALGCDKVSIYLLHVPDDSTPIESTMDGIQILYECGCFDEFGISNFPPSQLTALHTYAQSRSYILPTHYQSIYSLCSRLNERELFPLLRSLNINIQAYSALGSGFLTKTVEAVENGEGNFDKSTVLGKILGDMYGTPPFLNFLKEWRALVQELREREEKKGEVGDKKSGSITEAGTAYRWVFWNSGLDVKKGDMVVVGATGVRQLEEVVGEIERGPLEGWVVSRLEGMWRGVEGEAKGDNFGTFRRLRDAGVL